MSLRLTVACMLLFPVVTIAQSTDRDRVAAQKAQVDVDNAVRDSRTIETSDPDRAQMLLQNLVGRVQSASYLDEIQRAALSQRLQARLAQLNEAIRTRQVAAEVATKQAKEKTAPEASTPFPGQTTSDIARAFIHKSAADHAAGEKLRADTGAKLNDSISNVHASATPIDGLVEFPKNWAEKTESRKRFVGPQPSAKEVALLKALATPMSVDFNQAHFRDVLNFLMEKSDQPIIVDENSLKEAQVEYDDPVTFKAPKVTLRTVLRKVLADRGLSYVLTEGTIQVVTVQRARDMMVVRSYPVDDLIAADPRYGPVYGRQIEQQNVQGLIQSIQNSIDPALWSSNGGRGQVSYFEPGRALIIRASAEMHFMLASGGLLN